MYPTHNNHMRIQEEGVRKRLTTQQGGFKQRLLGTLEEGLMTSSVKSRPESGSDHYKSSAVPASDSTAYLTHAE